MSRDAYLFANCLTALNPDLFAYDLSLFPLALIFILIRVLWVEFFNVEVLYIRDSICHPPGDLLIMTDDHTGRAWKAGPHDIDIIHNKVTLIPDRGCCLP